MLDTGLVSESDVDRLLELVTDPQDIKVSTDPFLLRLP